MLRITEINWWRHGLNPLVLLWGCFSSWSLLKICWGATLLKEIVCTVPPFCTCWHFCSCSSCCLNILFYPLWLRTGVIPSKKHFLSLFNLDLPISDSLLSPSRLDIFLCVPLQPINQKFLKCSGYVSVLPTPPNFSYC